VTSKGVTHAIDELNQAKELFDQLPANVLNKSLKSKHAECLDALAQIYDAINRLEEAIHLRERSIAITEAFIAEFPESPNHKNSLADSQPFISGLLARQGQLAQAEARVKQEIQTRLTQVEQFSDLPNLQANLCRAYAVHGGMLHQMGKEAEAHAEVLLGIQLAPIPFIHWPPIKST